MSVIRARARIPIMHGTDEDWKQSNPILLEGELGYNTTTSQVKIGNGVDTFDKLKYLVNPIPKPTGEVWEDIPANPLDEFGYFYQKFDKPYKKITIVMDGYGSLFTSDNNNQMLLTLNFKPGMPTIQMWSPKDYGSPYVSAWQQYGQQPQKQTIIKIEKTEIGMESSLIVGAHVETPPYVLFENLASGNIPDSTGKVNFYRAYGKSDEESITSVKLWNPRYDKDYGGLDVDQPYHITIKGVAL